MIRLLNSALKRIRSGGLRRAAQFAWFRAVETVQLRRLGLRQAMKDTGLLLSRADLGYGDKPDFKFHEASHSLFVFRSLMQQYVRPSGNDVFIDYGSGLGRAVILAATFPFRRVIGVEFSSELNQRAAAILDTVRGRLACRNIELITADAGTYELPDDVNVVYFFNPFEGALFRRVIDNVKTSLLRAPRPMTILHCHLRIPSEMEKAAEGCNWIEKTGEAVFPALTQYRAVVYRTTGRIE